MEARQNLEKKILISSYNSEPKTIELHVGPSDKGIAFQYLKYV